MQGGEQVWYRSEVSVRQRRAVLRRRLVLACLFVLFGSKYMQEQLLIVQFRKSGLYSFGMRKCRQNYRHM